MLNLARATSVMLVISLLGVLGLAVLGHDAWRQARAHDAERSRLVRVQADADGLSASSDAILLSPLSADGLAQFDRRARQVQDRLRGWADTVPSVTRAIDAIDGMRSIARAHQRRTSPSTDRSGDGLGALDLPPEAVTAMVRMASFGSALDDVVGHLLIEREARASAIVRARTLQFATLATGFALVTLLSLWLVRRRMGVPIGDLASVVDRVRAGDLAARARARSDDELGRLARGINAMLDRIGRDADALEHREAQLRGSLADLDEAHRIARLGSWKWSIADDRVSWSDVCYGITGTDPRTFAPTLDAFKRLLHPHDVARFEAARAAVLEGLILLRLDVRLVRPDGEIVHLRLRGEATWDEHERPVHVMGTMQDVSDVVRGEAQRAEQRRLIASAGRIARVGGWSLDLASERLTLSERVLEMMELPPGTSLSLEEGLAFFAPDDRADMRARLERCAREGTPVDVERALETARGRRRWFHIAGEAVRDGAGRVHAIEGAQQDIEARRRSELRAERAGRRLGDVLRTIDEGFVTLDEDGHVRFANRAARHLLGLRSGSVGRAVWERLPAGSDVVPQLRRAVEARRSGTFETVVAGDRRVEIDLEPAAEGVALLVRDVTDRHRLLTRLQAREAELTSARDRLSDALELQEGLIDALPAHIAVVDADATILDVNERWRAFGRENRLADPAFGVGANYLDVARAAAGDGEEAADEAARGLEQVLDGERDAFTLQYPCHGPGQQRWFQMEVTKVSSGPDEARRAVVMHVDVTQSEVARRKLARLAFEDPLTGVLSRAGFVQELSAHLSREGWPTRGLVANLDVRGLNVINDRHGFAMGDALLTALGRRLRDQVDPAALVARVGGDEFAFLIGAGAVAESAVSELRRLLRSVFERPLVVSPEFEIELDAHVGFTRLGDERRSAETLLREAQLALFHGRAAGGLGWMEYSAELDHALQERKDLEDEFRTALARDEFRLHFHPQVRSCDGELYAAEALVRWQHPERGLLAPGAFVPLAEQSGLIVALGQWVLDAACRALARWRAEGLDLVRIAVNVSAEQFASGSFADDVAATLERHGVDPRALTLEVTESVFVRESTLLRRQLDALHELGVQLALDDFGTGYSSLAYLKAYPFDQIKIDRAFVADMLHDDYSRAIVETVLRIGATLGATVVAEGVESDAHRHALVGLGCEVAQGFHYCLPMNEEDFRWLLQTRRPLPLAVGVKP